MKKNKLIVVNTIKVGYGNFTYLIVRDHAAGKANRYTTYRIPAAPSWRIRIIGRELSLTDSKKIAKKDAKKHAD